METDVIRILLVEDDRLDAKAALRALAEPGLASTVTVAATLEEAKVAVAKAPFDIALLDYRLGSGTGLDVLEILGDLPAIMMTGSGNEAIAVQALRKGAYDYLVKDTSGNFLALLPQVIRNVLKRRQAELKQLELIEKLQAAVDEIHTLQGFIPICCKCRLIRDKDGYWQKLEQYLEQHTLAQVTHGYCEDCAEDAMQNVDEIEEQNSE